MKNKLLLSALLLAGFTGIYNAQVDQNGYTTVNATTGPAYQNRVFFDLSENTLTSQPANTWDVAFYRVSAMDFGSRINDAQNIEVYEASNNPADWDNINIANIGSWGDPLYNPDQTDKLQEGAFEKGSATYGWGEYLPNHHIDGKVIFVLKYLDNSSYIKFMITDYFGGYTFKYAKWNGSSWGTTVTKVIANGTTDSYFNYYSLINDAEVPNLEPIRANWDFMFTRYFTFYMGVMMYRLSGVIQSPRITVAKVQPETQSTSAINLPAAADFKKGITTIGHSWKPTTGIYSDVVYYIKENDKYYRMYFIENGGSSTGNMYFKYKDITSLLASSEANAKIAFGVYPNPAPNKQVTLLYDAKNGSKNANVSIFDMSGKKIYETEISNQQGFFKKELNLQNLQRGNYIIMLKAGDHVESKKLILQ